MPHQRQRTKGFTLIEMSIVIVIIGLIVGGVIASRSYVRNAELNTIMNESKYYINAFNQFQALYSNVPGDMATATNYWSGVTNGNGDGLIDAGVATMTNEVFYAFQHLAAAGLISGSYTGATSGPGGSYDAKIGVNVPMGDVSGVTYVFRHPSQADGVVSGDGFYQDGIYGHVLYVAAQPDASAGAAGTNLPTTAFLTPKEAYQVDGKFDDGNATTGWITVAKTTVNCLTGTAYDTGATNGGTKNCWLILNMR